MTRSSEAGIRTSSASVVPINSLGKGVPQPLNLQQLAKEQPETEIGIERDFGPPKSWGGSWDRTGHPDG